MPDDFSPIQPSAAASQQPIQPASQPASEPVSRPATKSDSPWAFKPVNEPVSSPVSQQVSPVMQPVMEAKPISTPAAVDPYEAHDPVQPVQPVYRAPTTKKPSGLWKILLTVFIVLIIGGGAYAGYYYNVWPFSLLNQTMGKEAALKAGIANLQTITSGRYGIQLKLASEARDNQLLSFDDLFTDEIKQQEQAISMDQDLLRNLENVLAGINSFYLDNNKYPTSLSEIAGAALLNTDNVTYQLSSDNSFFVTVQLKTDQGVEAIKMNIPSITVENNLVTIQGKNIKDWSPNFYLYDTSSQPAWMQMLSYQDEFFSFIPSDFLADLNVGGTLQKSTAEQINSQFQAGANVNFGDLSIAVDLEMSKVGEDFYARVNKFPSFYYDLSLLKEKWIKITKEDLVSSSNFPLDTIGWLEKDADNSQDVNQQLQKILQLAFDQGVYQIDYNQPDRLINQTDHYVYRVSLNQDKIVSFYDATIAELNTAYGDKALIKENQEFRDFIQSPSLAKFVTYLNTNSQFELAVDKKSGYIDFLNYSLKLVPSKDSSAAERQIAISWSLNLTEVNQTLQVNAPAEFMTFDQAWGTLTGMTEEEVKFQRQMSNVGAVRSALSRFHRVSGKFPTSLDELLKKSSEVTAGISEPTNDNGVRLNFPDDSFYPDTLPFLQTVPKDVYTGEPFGYIVSADDYLLTYQMKALQRNKAVEQNSMMGMISVNDVVTFVDGKNTANKTTESVEAQVALKIDSDSDGLPDVVENYYGSSNSSKDSDGDKYNDAEEVKNGYDPAGPGKLNYNEVWYNIKFPDISL